MTRDELYINNSKVDIGKTDITLNYKSNLLTDISKIVSNNSYTIKLPKTAKNLSLIECSNIPSSVSKFPYLKHAGKVLRNGIEIIKDANVVLLSVADSIETALSWGNVTNFSSVVNDGKKLTDISHGTEEGVDWVVWNNQGSNSVQFPLIDYGFNSGDPNVWYRPVITVKWILDKIQEESGVTFNFPSDKQDFIGKMIVPLLANNDSQELYDKYPIKFTGNIINYDNSYNGERGLNLVLNIDSTLSKYGELANIINANITGVGYKVAYDLKASLKGTVIVSTSTPGDDKTKALLHVRLEDGGHNTVAYINPISTSSGDGKTHISYKVDINEFNINEGQILCLSFLPYSKPDILISGDYVNIDLSLNISNRGEVYFGEKFPLVPNLPDIKQIDFIKAIASMVGLFALPDGTNGIKFIPFDNLAENQPKAVDWTNKVIMAYKDVTPREIKYSLDNIAQNNWFRYKEDDKVTGNYDGNIQVEDATIDYERDAITLPFSACDTKNGVAYIPLYSYNDKGELQYNKTNPRILLLDGTKGIFKGLEWTTLIANNYQTYKGLINNAKVVTEYIRLNSIELRNLEMDVPVYLAQYGCYLAIIEIKTRENDICECKLLKM